jgi:hypothetical protein
VPGKNAREAIETFAGFMNETLGCLTDRKLVAYQEAENTFKLLYKSPIPILSTSGKRFYLQVTQICNAEMREDGTFKAHTREYSYVFSGSPAHTHHGIFAYHWHPYDFDLRAPHLHITITPQIGSPEIEGKISKAHFPTSRVCLEDFVDLLLRYYDIRSPLHHSRYRSILRRNRREFSKGATWTVHPLD